MILLLPLLIPVVGAAVLLSLGTDGRARFLALVIGAAEIAAILRVALPSENSP